MNKLKYILGFVLLAHVYSCTDFVDPAIPYSNFETAVYLRTITAPQPINFFDLANENFSVVVEAVDEENGNLVQEVDVYVKRRRGAALTAEVKVSTVAKTAFAPNSESKYLRATITVPISEALAAMGLTTADINQGDFFEFRFDLLDTKGRRFSNTNLSSDVISGGYYLSPFFYRVGVVCPSNLAKTYNGHTDWIDYYGDPGSNDYVVNLTAVAGQAGRYLLPDLSGGMEPIVWGGNPVVAQIDDVCGQIALFSAPYAYAYYIDRAGNSFGTGSNVNLGTGVITIYWINAYDEHGRTILTPQ